MIKPADLHKVWAAPDNTRLTSKQLSFRLPVHVAAKLSALCEMFPEKTRTQLVGDLLAAALDDFERSFESIKGQFIYGDHETGEEIYDEIGPVKEYRRLADRYYRDLEIELGNENPKSLFDRPEPKKTDE
ncbi:MAG: hypothetical protein Q8K18_19390 [Burkholderiales bacterium]|nr:hypothetical protein [Burkholderiales bacterium]